MNTADFITALSKKRKQKKPEITRLLEDTVSIITSELQNNNTVSLINVGILEVKKRNERITVNPASKKRMLVPPKLVVKFKPTTSFKNKFKEMLP